MRCLPVALLLAVLGSGCAGDHAGVVDTRRSVVLIVVDTLRADHLGTYGYTERLTSPSIDRWAEEGLVFEHAWATSSWTLPSFGSLLTGHLPTVHLVGLEADRTSGVPAKVVPNRSFATLSERLPTLAEVLSGRGFVTGALVSNPLLDPVFGLDRGFALYDAHEADNRTLRSATETVDDALAWIDATEGAPFFLLMHFFGPHMDYDAPPPYRGRFTAAGSPRYQLPVRGVWPMRMRIDEIDTAEREFITAAYDEEIAYVDAEIGRFLAQMNQRPSLRDALVMLTSDHGEELFDHGGFEHGHAMYDEVLRVPMILWSPQVEPGRESMPVSLLDVMPTILHAAGVAEPAEQAEGSSLSGLPGISLLDAARPDWPRQRVIVAERQLYGPEVKTIVNWPFKAMLEVDEDHAVLFDLSADPRERLDMAQARPNELDAMLAALAGQLDSAQALRAAATGAEINEALLRRLRALGYIR